MKSHKHKIGIYDARTAGEAMDYIFAGLKYFLTYHTKKTVLTLLIFLAALAIAAQDYLSTEKIKVKELSPLSETFSVIPRAVALGNDDAIIVNGKTYGFSDPTFQIWKLHGEDAIVVLHKPTGKLWKFDIPFLQKAK